MQPMTLPRPDLAQQLNISYRRIPLLAVGSSIYADTRIILSTLSSLYPESSTPNAILQPLPDTLEARAVTKYLSATVIGGEIFSRASQLIPLTSPVWKNNTFMTDRAQMTGRQWSKSTAERGRPEALVVVRNYFSELENGLLSDGRQWLLNTSGPTIADIEAVWVPVWVIGMPDALPKDMFTEESFPKLYAYAKRFLGAVGEAKKKNGKAQRLDGKTAASKVLAGKRQEVSASVNDPHGLKPGQEVVMWPIDSGFSHKDQGKLLSLTWDQIVIEKQVDGEAGKGSISLHFPRTGFRIAAAEKAKL